MASSGSRVVVRKVKPLLSLDRSEARKRVINLYKAWYRQAPFIVLDYIIPLNTEQIRQKIKEEFRKNAHVTDIRVIDMLVIKGQLELQETVNSWKQNCSVMYMVKDTANPKPTTFLSKFLEGTE